MTDYIFNFEDEYFYSNCFANWQEVKEGQDIIMVTNNDKYQVVRNDIISFYKDFSIENPQ